MILELPKNCLVDKFVSKTKFTSQVLVNTKLKDEFTREIKRITWKYKLAETTLMIQATQKVKEIQIFEIELKNKEIPKNVLKLIDKLIPYYILYYFKYENNFAFGITLKDNVSKDYYFSDWNEELKFNFHAINLKIVLENIIKQFIKRVDTDNNNFQDIIEKDKQITILTKEIQALKNKIKQEKQFNKKVELNKTLQEKQKLLGKLK
ncbi:DUF4391 domain-containing protein [Candidatus Vampirococcus lugosii]